MSSDLSRRLAQIERQLSKVVEERKNAACRCRGEGKAIPETNYHTAQELERILWEPCPVHGVREPGFIWWISFEITLQEPDWKFCTCPPDPLRDYDMGKRGLPSHDEVEKHREDRWRELVTDVPEEVRKARFQEEHARYEDVVATFARARSAVRAGGDGWKIWRKHDPLARNEQTRKALPGPCYEERVLPPPLESRKGRGTRPLGRPKKPSRHHRGGALATFARQHRRYQNRDRANDRRRA